ncbi:hypothetical protein KC321_g60 [Hortaea werneckii]|nr:hypothetical protein KC321_g60 [Hortaea werneckii]
MLLVLGLSWSLVAASNHMLVVPKSIILCLMPEFERFECRSAITTTTARDETCISLRVCDSLVPYNSRQNSTDIFPILTLCTSTILQRQTPARYYAPDGFEVELVSTVVEPESTLLTRLGLGEPIRLCYDRARSSALSLGSAKLQLKFAGAFYLGYHRSTLLTLVKTASATTLAVAILLVFLEKRRILACFVSRLSNCYSSFSRKWQSLEYRCRLVIETASETTSSKLADIRVDPMEINYTNGYIVRMGENLGIMCNVNRTMVDMMEAKVAIRKNKQALKPHVKPSAKPFRTEYRLMSALSNVICALSFFARPNVFLCSVSIARSGVTLCPELSSHPDVTVCPNMSW